MSERTARPEPRLDLVASPHLKAGDTTARIMWTVVATLVPVVVMATWRFGPSALLVIAAATAGALITERAFAGREAPKDGSAAITGLLLGLTLPPSLPLWMAFLGGVVGIGLGKLIWGGLGGNPYVGPRSIQQGEALHGRGVEVMDLHDSLKAQRIVVLHSPSGAGKSSLVQAGLIPKLQASKFAVWKLIRVNLDPTSFEGLPEGTNRYLLSAMVSLEEELPAKRRRSPVELAGFAQVALRPLDRFAQGRRHEVHLFARDRQWRGAADDVLVRLLAEQPVPLERFAETSRTARLGVELDADP